MKILNYRIEEDFAQPAVDVAGNTALKPLFYSGLSFILRIAAFPA
jgi:hypothetical protein